MPEALAPGVGLLSRGAFPRGSSAAVRPDTGNRLCGHLSWQRQDSKPRPAASLAASCTAVMQRWARRLASSWPWARCR